MSVDSLPAPRPAVVIWLDRWHAFVARRADGGRGSIVEVNRDADPEPVYLHRVAEIAYDARRVMILGPDDDREAFDREYESMYERSDRFVDVEACPWPSSAGLLDRLRFLEDEGPTGRFPG